MLTSKSSHKGIAISVMLKTSGGLIIAAIITPPDVFSQIMVTIPLYALYELSIFISKSVYKRIKKQETGTN